MRKANNFDGTISISRYGASAVEVEIEDDVTTLDEALENADINDLSTSETIWVNGDKATTSDVLNDGDTVQIVGKKEGGLK